MIDDQRPYEEEEFGPNTVATREAAAEGAWPVMPAAAYHGLAGEVVACLSPQTESDPNALLLQYLTSFGNVVGRLPYYFIEGAQHFPNLFVVLAGESSKSRKGTSAQHIRNIIRIADPEWATNNVPSGISSGEGIIHTIRDPVYGMKKGVEELIDAGIDDKRVMFDEREFSQALRVMNREGNVVSRVVRDAWDSPEVLQTVTKHSPTRATHPHISIVGHITIMELRMVLDQTSMANGFANRFLFACVRRSKLLPHGGALDAEVIKQLGTRTLAAVTAARAINRVVMTPAAHQRWDDVYEGLSESRQDLLSYITSRGEAQTTRLALIYALLDGAAEIDTAHLEAALATWSYGQASAAYIFGDLIGDPIADAILRALRAGGALGMSRADITALFGRHIPTGKFKRRWHCC
jgi:hypothetical protein